jgi:bifunctional oligoribonuclease and PAP phosphatase NrnA
MFMTAHVGPDGDTLGSMLALYHAFSKERMPNIERIDCLISGKMPDVYHFLPGLSQVQLFEQITQPLETRYDVAISFDCGSIDRLGPCKAHFSGAKTSINVDHHISNDLFGDINIVEPTASASGQVVAGILDAMDIPFTQEIATCLYTAIVSDTGGFKYSNTTPAVLRVSARLIEAGANPELIFKALYEERPLKQVRLQAEAILKAEFNASKTLAWSNVTREMLTRHGAHDEHIDGLVEALRQIDTVQISAMFKETQDGLTKVSLRSDNHLLDVAEVMGAFEGGGHKMAAGCTIGKPLAEARPLVLEKLEALLKILDAAHASSSCV